MGRHVAPEMIRDIMTPRPRTVAPKTSVRTLQHLFISYGFNAFPVVDEAHSLLGIVTKLGSLARRPSWPATSSPRTECPMGRTRR